MAANKMLFTQWFYEKEKYFGTDTWSKFSSIFDYFAGALGYMTAFLQVYASQSSKFNCLLKLFTDASNFLLPKFCN